MTETPERRVPTVAKPSASLMGWGVFLTVAGIPLALASAALVPEGTDPIQLAWTGLVVTVAGAALLATGVHRWAQHADRAAGITVPAVTAMQKWSGEGVASDRTAKTS